jgi:tRNA A37 threonylcarbamoyladenosine dehydratase
VYSPERLPVHKEIALSCGSGLCMCSKEAKTEWCSRKKIINGSFIGVTASAGMTLSSLVVKSVCGYE